MRQLNRTQACLTATAQAQGSRPPASSPDLVHVRGEERIVCLDAAHKAAGRDVAALALLPADLQAVGRQACERAAHQTPPADSRLHAPLAGMM